MKRLPMIAVGLALGFSLNLNAGGADAAGSKPADTEPWLMERLAWFQDMKFGFMMHWGAYSQWGCIESWPLVEEDKWARPDDLPAWTERGKDMERFKKDYWK